jgi:polyferredoxin
MLYTFLWGGIGLALVVALFLRSDLDVDVSPVRNPTFITLSDGTVRNTFDLRLRNKAGEIRSFQISARTDTPLRLIVEGHDGLYIPVPADATLTLRVYVEAAAGSPAALAKQSNLRLWIEDPQGRTRVAKDTHFNGKGAN